MMHPSQHSHYPSNANPTNPHAEVEQCVEDALRKDGFANRWTVGTILYGTGKNRREAGKTYSLGQNYEGVCVFHESKPHVSVAFRRILNLEHVENAQQQCLAGLDASIVCVRELLAALESERDALAKDVAERRAA